MCPLTQAGVQIKVFVLSQSVLLVSKCVCLALLILIGSPELQLPASATKITFYGQYVEV